MSRKFDPRDRVTTPKGSGSVSYRRMKGPDYAEVESYSVVLDASMQASRKPPFPQYSGTIFPASEVSEEK